MTDERHEGNSGTDVPVDNEVAQNAKERVAGIDQKYAPGSRPTVVLPGTGGMVSGTAFADMVDENGDLKDDTTTDA
ncbi:MAG: hypothetical protein WBB62_19415 [Rhodococcus sp. (in: high G+C Gram-positive bacteria)]